ncbi:MAG TPA: cytochrome P450 [Acidimicrobiales bacterium]|nr:cytochrome P450 [Acidimicrobiales bacterium]
MTRAETKSDLPDIDPSQEGWSVGLFIDQEFCRDPRPFYERLRGFPPGRDDLRTMGQKPTVVVTRHQDVEYVFRNPQLFSSQFGEGMAGIGNDRPLIPLQIDPPDHKKYRVLLDPYFAPREMAKLEPKLADLTNSLIDRFAERGSCDLVSEFAVPYPCQAFLELVGLPLEDLDKFLHIKEGIIRGYGAMDMEEAARNRQVAGRECYDYFEGALDELEKERRPGLLSQLLDAEVDGERLTRQEILDICFLLIIAGLDTVTDSLCCFFNYLANEPDHRARMVEDPSVVPAVVEELLRWESPVAGVARIATEDTELSGCPVQKGDSLLVFVGAANTDVEALDTAHVVDFNRETNRHYAFGGGIHRCLGSHLARTELRVALREWHKRIPDYRIADGAELLWTPMLRAVMELPLEWAG